MGDMQNCRTDFYELWVNYSSHNEDTIYLVNQVPRG